MMNQHYGFSGRRGRSGFDRGLDQGYDRGGFDRAPYRRPVNRSGMPDRGLHSYGGQSAPHANSGCRCGFVQNSTGLLDRSPLSHSHDGPGYVSPTVTASNSDCGCGKGEHMENSCPICNGNHNGNHTCDGNDATCKRLMSQIRAVDFALYETVLYLDVYPNSCDALETYHKLKAQSKALHKEYEAVCAPLTAFGNESTASWDWMSNPFPWEYDAD